MKNRRKDQQFLANWIVDETALTARHCRTGLVVEFLVNEEGWTARLATAGSATPDEQQRYAQEAGEFFAQATGGNIDGGGAFLEIPEGWEWPLLGFDSTTGVLQLRNGFAEDLAKLYQVSPKKLRPDMMAGFLLSWYESRRAQGAAEDPIMEDVIRYHQRISQSTK